MKTLICKKDLIGDRTYRKGKKYQIYIDGKNETFVLTDEFSDDSHSIKGLWFDGISNKKKIKDYFYTDQELRKEKLKILNKLIQ